MDKLETYLPLLGRDVMDVLVKRYAFLRAVRFYAPVGRRALSVSVGCTEREARNETKYLRSMGLLQADSAGMNLTLKGAELLEALQEFISHVSQSKALEEKLLEKGCFEKVTVVMGNATRHQLILRDMGQAAAVALRDLLAEVKTVGVSGHRVMRYLCDAQYPHDSGSHAAILPLRDAHFTEEDELANTHCARLARKMGAEYMLLHLAHNLSINELEHRFREEDVKRVVNLLKQADVFAVGLNTLEHSEIFQKMGARAQGTIVQSNAVCELLGTFYRGDGRQVNNTPLYSVPLEWFIKAKRVLLAASGRELASVLPALGKRLANVHLITDEDTALEMLR